MYVDFTALNQTYLKDCYPLSCIDALVDSMMNYEIFYFLNAFKGYHQIAIKEDDQDKTIFITNQDAFYYTIISCDLKNIETAYQRLVNKLFR